MAYRGKVCTQLISYAGINFNGSSNKVLEWADEVAAYCFIIATEHTDDLRPFWNAALKEMPFAQNTPVKNAIDINQSAQRNKEVT